MQKILKKSQILGVLAGLLIISNAQAAQINGTINFLGNASATKIHGITTINFANPWMVTIGDLDYAVPTGPTAATFSSISFTGTGANAVLTGAVAPLWTFDIGSTTYSFNLDVLTSGTVGLGSVALSGTGIAKIDGKDNTEATWTLSNAGGNLSFRFSSSSTATPTSVPDGGMTLMLLGGVLAGLGFLRNKFNVA